MTTHRPANIQKHRTHREGTEGAKENMKKAADNEGMISRILKTVNQLKPKYLKKVMVYASILLEVQKNGDDEGKNSRP